MSVDQLKPPGLSFDVGTISNTLQGFIDGSTKPFETSVDKLVRVRVGGSLNVVSIEFLHPKMDAALKRELETATVAAINLALQKATLAAGDALTELAEKFRETGAT